MEQVNINNTETTETTEATNQEVIPAEQPMEPTLSASDAVVATGVAGALIGLGFGIAKVTDNWKEKRAERKAEKEANKKEKDAEKAAKKPLLVRYLEGQGYHLEKVEEPKQDSEEEDKSQSGNKSSKK